ncbi:hypothetical protein SSS_04745 [Sarcoptes scabiei]|nr:hypothetical protein SSS_04745 [Sarcoptes scabiei]
MANSRIRIDPISMIFLLLLMVWNILIIIPYHSSLPISSTSSQPFYKAIRERLFIPKTFPTNLFKSNFRRSLFSSSSPSSLNENDELLLNTMKDRLLLIKPILFQRSIPSRKRSCLINAGLSNNCDFRDFISAANARRIWESQASPGKRSAIYSNFNDIVSKSSDSDLSPSLSSSSTTSSSPSSSSSYGNKLSPLSNSIQSKDSLGLMEENDSPSSQLIESFRDRKEDDQSNQSIRNLLNPINPEQTILAKNSIENDRIIKRMNCISGLPGGDCENFFLGSESLGQDFLRPGGRNPGKR